MNSENKNESTLKVKTLAVDNKASNVNTPAWKNFLIIYSQLSIYEQNMLSKNTSMH